MAGGGGRGQRGGGEGSSHKDTGHTVLNSEYNGSLLKMFGRGLVF